MLSHIIILLFILSRISGKELRYIEDQKVMDYEQALKRIPDRELPQWWVGDFDTMQSHLENSAKGELGTLAVSPGGRKVSSIFYGTKEGARGNANFNSAVGARCINSYADRSKREKPVVMFVGTVHGHEVEGLNGLMHLISVLETGKDLKGTPRLNLQKLGQSCRLLIVPASNPDGNCRFRPKALNGMEHYDLRWWGQGTWKNGDLCGWPGCKAVHPVQRNQVGFLGCYFNDAGINPQHDEFFSPMGPESRAILDLAREEAPDAVAVLHSHEHPPKLCRPAYVPLEVQEEVCSIAGLTWSLYDRVGLEHRGIDRPSPERGPNPAPLNLTSALYHVSGAVPFTFESAHGLRGEKWAQAQFCDLLEMQMLLYEALFTYLLESKKTHQV